MSESLTSRVAQAILRDYITGGRRAPGEPLPPLRELEQEYGASVATVAHALGQLQALGWLVKGKGRRAIVADKAAAGQEGGNIGLALTYDGSAALPMRIYRGIEEAARLEGYHVVVATSPSLYYPDERETVLRLRDAGCRAIILNAAVRTEAELEHDYLNEEALDTPIVLLDMAWPQQRRSQVIFDNYGAGLAMTQHLIEQGHRRIGFMTLGKKRRLMWRSNMDRFRGYRAALRRMDIAPDSALEWDVDPFADGLEQACRMLEAWRSRPKRSRPTAVVAIEDTSASMIVAEAREMGIAVPEDLTVVGFDDTASPPPVRQGFYTTAPDFALAGATAVELALREVRGEPGGPVTYMLPAPLVQRTARRGQRATVRA